MITSRYVLIVGLAFSAPAIIAAQGNIALGSEPKTTAAVTADDEQWAKAETSGDSEYVDALLLPSYRSISSDGRTHDKKAILAQTVLNKNTNEGKGHVEAWQASHPNLTSVEINGDVAILTFASLKGSEPHLIFSCDIFVYREGHWRALYSQHTEAEK
jgi:hypothetical protein